MGYYFFGYFAFSDPSRVDSQQQRINRRPRHANTKQTTTKKRSVHLHNVAVTETMARSRVIIQTRNVWRGRFVSHSPGERGVGKKRKEEKKRKGRPLSPARKPRETDI